MTASSGTGATGSPGTAEAGSVDAALRLERVTFGYRRAPVLCDISLAVPAGQTTVLLGRNGAGKSTLLRLCLGLLRPRAGQVRVLGLDPVRDAFEVCTRVGYVPDRPDAWSWMRVPDLFRYLAVHQPRWDAGRAREWAARLEVSLDRPFRALSRGEGMKAMLVAALAPDPDLLLLDEPFGGLDPVARDEVVRALVGALGERRRTVLVSTHELDLAARLGDRVAILEDGQIREEGPLEALLGTVEGGAAAALRARLEAAGRERRWL